MPIFTAEAPATNEKPAIEESPKRLSEEQAAALFHLIKAFRPEWANWTTVMRRLQDTALYTDLPGSKIVSLVVDAAVTNPVGGSFQDLPFLGVNPHRDDEE